MQVLLYEGNLDIFPDILPIDDGQNSWDKSFDQKAAVKREAIAIAQKGAY